MDPQVAFGPLLAFAQQNGFERVGRADFLERHVNRQRDGAGGEVEFRREDHALGIRAPG